VDGKGQSTISRLAFSLVQRCVRAIGHRRFESCSCEIFVYVCLWRVFPSPRVNNLILQEFTRTLTSSVCVPSTLFSSNTLNRHWPSRSILQSRSQVSLQFTNSRTLPISESTYIGRSSFQMLGWHLPQTTLSSSCHLRQWIGTRRIRRSISIGFDD
jgi:hypothetical protein